MLGNKIFNVAIETSNGKVGFTVGFDVMVSMLHLKFLDKTDLKSIFLM
ncbi:hypothetical protein Hanom_Chr08g00750001 [Helianthus anomalus]